MLKLELPPEELRIHLSILFPIILLRKGTVEVEGSTALNEVPSQTFFTKYPRSHEILFIRFNLKKQKWLVFTNTFRLNPVDKEEAIFYSLPK